MTKGSVFDHFDLDGTLPSRDLARALVGELFQADEAGARRRVRKSKLDTRWVSKFWGGGVRLERAPTSLLKSGLAKAAGGDNWFWEHWVAKPFVEAHKPLFSLMNQVRRRWPDHAGGFSPRALTFLADRFQPSIAQLQLVDRRLSQTDSCIETAGVGPVLGQRPEWWTSIFDGSSLAEDALELLGWPELDAKATVDLATAVDDADWSAAHGIVEADESSPTWHALLHFLSGDYTGCQQAMEDHASGHLLDQSRLAALEALVALANNDPAVALGAMSRRLKAWPTWALLRARAFAQQEEWSAAAAAVLGGAGRCYAAFPVQAARFALELAGEKIPPVLVDLSAERALTSHQRTRAASNLPKRATEPVVVQSEVPEAPIVPHDDSGPGPAQSSNTDAPESAPDLVPATHASNSSSGDADADDPAVQSGDIPGPAKELPTDPAQALLEALTQAGAEIGSAAGAGRWADVQRHTAVLATLLDQLRTTLTDLLDGTGLNLTAILTAGGGRLEDDASRAVQLVAAALEERRREEEVVRRDLLAGLRGRAERLDLGETRPEDLGLAELRALEARVVLEERIAALAEQARAGVVATRDADAHLCDTLVTRALDDPGLRLVAATLVERFPDAYPSLDDEIRRVRDAAPPDASVAAALVAATAASAQRTGHLHELISGGWATFLGDCAPIDVPLDDARQLLDVAYASPGGWTAFRTLLLAGTPGSNRADLAARWLAKVADEDRVRLIEHVDCIRELASGLSDDGRWKEATVVVLAAYKFLGDPTLLEGAEELLVRLAEDLARAGRRAELEMLLADSSWLTANPERIPIFLEICATAQLDELVELARHRNGRSFEDAAVRWPVLVKEHYLQAVFSLRGADGHAHVGEAVSGLAAIRAFESDLRRPSAYNKWPLARDYQRSFNARLKEHWASIQTGAKGARLATDALRDLDADVWITEAEADVGQPAEFAARENMVRYLAHQRERLLRVGDLQRRLDASDLEEHLAGSTEGTRQHLRTEFALVVGRTPPAVRELYRTLIGDSPDE